MKENQFIARVVVPFPYDLVGRKLEQWVNLQHAGKPQIPLDEEVSKEHADAHQAEYGDHGSHRTVRGL